MKNIFSFVMLSLICFNAQAQMTFDMAFMPDINDSVRYQYADTSNFNPGSDGNGVTWNFSAVADSASSYKFEYVDVDSTPHGASFPQPGTMASADGAGNYHFYRAEADSFYKVGEATAITYNAVANYTNPFRIYDFPFNVGDTIRDLYNGSYMASGFPNTFRTGSSVIYQSGNGTLLMPNDTVFTNVTRVYKEYHIKDSSNIIGLDVINLFDFYYYEWYSATSEIPLMIYETRDFNLAGNPTSDKFLSYATFPDTVPVAQDIKMLTGLTIYPNPSAGNMVLSFTLSQTTELRIELRNLQGQLLRILSAAAFPSGMHSIQISGNDLANGIYLLNIDNGQSIVTRKLVIGD